MLPIYQRVDVDLLFKGQKPYSCTKYQMGDVTDSYEQQMLRSLQREAASDAVESEDERPSTNLPFGYDTLTDSSDDLSTVKSPVVTSEF